MTTEDDLDTETLQAQIDLSLAYVGDLVSSWIKPSVKASLPKPDGTKEREIEEIMRRPPRLGVGAPIPETSGLTQAAARLKGKLVDKPSKKRAREEERDARRQSSDDDEESRAFTVKKRVKVDPFAVGKRPTVVTNGLLTPQLTLSPSNLAGSPGGTRSANHDTVPDPNTQTEKTSSDPTPKKKKKKKKSKKDLEFAGTAVSASFSSPDRSVSAAPQCHDKQQHSPPQGPSPLSSPNLVAKGSHVAPHKLNGVRLNGTTSSPSPSPSSFLPPFLPSSRSQDSRPKSFHKKILNLNGPLPEAVHRPQFRASSNSPGREISRLDDIEGRNSRARKKRRRHKKRKSSGGVIWNAVAAAN